MVYVCKNKAVKLAKKYVNYARIYAILGPIIALFALFSIDFNIVIQYYYWFAGAYGLLGAFIYFRYINLATRL